VILMRGAAGWPYRRKVITEAETRDRVTIAPVDSCLHSHTGCQDRICSRTSFVRHRGCIGR